MVWTTPKRGIWAPWQLSLRTILKRVPSAEEITTVGIDLAKSVFQTHAIDAEDPPVVARSCDVTVTLAP